MAHIVNCMLDHESGYIVKADSPQPPNDPSDKASLTEKPFVWRMHQQPERKYQLFPKEKQAVPATGKGLDPEQAFALAMGQSGEKTDKPPAGNGLRLRIKEHNLIRRRKVSVPELGPMTTVQEVAMDSPTIPGRPPLHERSISAPGHSWRLNHLADCVADIPPAHDENAELTMPDVCESPSIFRQPLSPKSLAPLIIPSLGSTVPRLTRQLSLNRLRSGSTPVEPTARSAQTDDSPMTTKTPFTPLSAATQLTTPRSATTAAMIASSVATPISAPAGSRSSPQPWGEPSHAVKDAAADPNATPKAEPESRIALSHRRGQSDSGSIMERGRPRKRSEGKESGTILKRSVSKRRKSTERRAFETLPKGWKASEAANMLNKTELGALQKQAMQQAARFEVLRKEDVDRLSMELRNLDERTEYLRRTYTSLRAGRRNLHSRICTYLRSPRVAKFSHDSMLKQEEALAELDASIDDWVTKLEQAENRRTRVRQKLLEHVAAAATLPSPTGSVVGVSESLQMAMGIKPPTMPNGTANISTPPRSPAKATFAPSSTSQSGSPSPQRVVAQVPSTIFEQPLGEEAASKDTLPRRVDVESIRIYAGDDVYALLADVENEITKMSNGDNPFPKDAKVSDDERKQIHREKSQEILNGAANKSSPASAPVSPKGSPVRKNTAVEGEMLLTAAVFRP